MTGGQTGTGRAGGMPGGAGASGGVAAGGLASSPDDTGGIGSDAGASGGIPDASTEESQDLGSGGVGGASSSRGLAGSRTGGVPASGGVTGSGGAVTASGASATGGKPGTGGSAGSGGISAGCGTAKSTFSETLTFSKQVVPLSTPTTTLSSATTFTSSTAGPGSNRTLCSNGCAVLSVHFKEGLAARQATAAQRIFSAPVNLVGATIAFDFAISNPAQVPVHMQVYAASDIGVGGKWAAPTTVAGADLAAFAAANGFATESLSPVDDPNGYCASATKLVGLQVQNTAAITSTTTGTVTIFIDSIRISAP